MPDSRFLSPRQAAEFIERHWHYRVSVSAIRRWVTRGSLPHVRDEHGHILIDRADLYGAHGEEPDVTEAKD